MKTKSDMKPFIIAALSLTLLVVVMMIFRQKNRKSLWRLLLRL